MTSFTEFVREINSEEKCIDFLIEKNIFKNTMKCPLCEKQLTLNRESKFFRCRNSSNGRNKKRKKNVQCNFVQSYKTGTWFENVRLPLLTAITFIVEWLWLSPPRFGFTSDDLRISSHTFVDWSSFCREVRFYVLFYMYYIGNSCITAFYVKIETFSAILRKF